MLIHKTNVVCEIIEFKVCDFLCFAIQISSREENANCIERFGCIGNTAACGPIESQFISDTE